MTTVLQILSSYKTALVNIICCRQMGQCKFSYTMLLSALHIFFYKKLRSGAGRQFLEVSGHFAIKSFVHVS